MIIVPLHSFGQQLAVGSFTIVVFSVAGFGTIALDTVRTPAALYATMKAGAVSYMHLDEFGAGAGFRASTVPARSST